MSFDKKNRPRKKGGLGRGLSALLGEIAEETSGDNPDIGNENAPSGAVRSLPVAAIFPHPDQPRRIFDETALNELTESIAQRGVLQPIVVRPKGSGWQIVAGERRWRAAQRARLHDIPVIVREFDESETLEVALIENIQRSELNAIEEAKAYQRLAEQFGHSPEALSKLVRKSRSHITNLLRLLDLPEVVQDALITRQLTMGHARALITAPDPQKLAEKVIEKGLSVRDTEKLVQEIKNGKSKEPPSKAKKGQTLAADGDDADILALQQLLTESLKLPVTIAYNGESGTISLDYSSMDELDFLFQRLSGSDF
ncbi:ParB/RepB/Spo0J family partition protein [Zymomonas mobilis]|uniref:ParB/RepB/Spo0J family partition protein n=1 Tax=Zymomonas mobilis TaxID=542 RepID=UPI0003C76B5D|nr:ParB/RepB/Spo0J family partition protein [Zymomonas mobilis]AHB10524.1 chromosome segregation DNA-binding protein [Zymomonas mobilis subsp. mobilis str. CP4 = NRRL B-14023]AHJ70830.1 Chromosome-partitioning protein parB [Zymomonas mobilis subsp. mobilis NRRL B-12526]AHJ72684.1 Chromosome-partitioning protein parB [Zymomonas mobilis subsp. mobilis str. CP4 = NRRL B-14023]TWE24968.1 ParB family chromosome partitioning protein [Zymomonas mobilis]